MVYFLYCSRKTTEGLSFNSLMFCGGVLTVNDWVLRWLRFFGISQHCQPSFSCALQRKLLLQWFYMHTFGMFSSLLSHSSHFAVSRKAWVRSRSLEDLRKIKHLVLRSRRLLHSRLPDDETNTSKTLKMRTRILVGSCGYVFRSFDSATRIRTAQNSIQTKNVWVFHLKLAIRELVGLHKLAIRELIGLRCIMGQLNSCTK